MASSGGVHRPQDLLPGGRGCQRGLDLGAEPVEFGSQLVEPWLEPLVGVDEEIVLACVALVAIGGGRL